MMRSDGPIRVLHVIHWPKSGIVTLIKNYLESNRDERFEYHVLLFIADVDTVELFRQHSASVTCIHYDRNKVRAIIAYRSLIHRIAPHVIHTHSFQPGIWGRLFAVCKKIKTISTVHSPYPYLEERTMRSKVKRLVEISTINLFNSKVICVSEYVKKYLAANTNINKDLMTVVRCGIPLDDFPRERAADFKLRSRYNVNENTKIIISVGRLSEEKGFDILLKAFALAKQRYDNMILLLVGDGPQQMPLSLLSKELHIADTVLFLGFRRNVQPLLSIADLYVCCSRFEGLGLAILEALKAKLPVIATAVGGISEIIRNGENGILIEPENTELMANTIVKFFFDYNAQYLKEADLKQFDITKTINNYENIYLTVNNMKPQEEGGHEN